MAQWLAQESYTFKVVGSSPTAETKIDTIMKEEISEYYKSKGFITVYINTNKEPRRVATLRKSDGTMVSMSYAKYLYTSHYKTDIAKGGEVDHINGDRMDDKIENLQVISGKYNRQKDHKRKEMIICICPVCKKEFLFEKRNLSTRPEPCCSRKCGGIKSHWNNNK